MADSTFTIFAMFTAKNYAVPPNLSQENVDFEKLYDAMIEMFQIGRFDIDMAIPNVYLDLKGQTLMRQEELASLSYYLTQISEHLKKDWGGGVGVIDSPASVELLSGYNSFNHHPAIIPFLISGSDSDIYKWTNEFLANDMEFGTQENPVAGVMPFPAILASAFPSIGFEPCFVMHIQENREFQELLLREMRTALSGADLKKFDKKMARVNRVNKIIHRLETM